MLYEEVIPVKHFLSALRNSDVHEETGQKQGGVVAGIQLRCCNEELNLALEGHWESPPTTEDGSDTRSLAHHVSGLNVTCSSV